MVTLVDQIKEDLQKLFFEDVSYSDIIVKEKYDILPKVSYPCVLIEETENNDVEKYHDETEEITGLAYIITINAEQSEDKTAIQNVRTIADKIDTYFKGEEYRCLKRLGGLILKPLPNDDTVMTGYLTYNCYVSNKTNTIYRRT